jgi:hypothetical protein
MHINDYCELFVSSARSEAKYRVVGRNISLIKELKIIFDGYGYDEETDTEGGDTNTEAYCLFVHKDAASRGFEFPEHDLSYGLIEHRSGVEICIDLAYDVIDDRWHVNFPADDSGELGLNEARVIEILASLHKRLSD